MRQSSRITCSICDCTISLMRSVIGRPLKNDLSDGWIAKRGIDRDPLEIPQRSAGMCDPQTFRPVTAPACHPAARANGIRSKRSCEKSCWKNSSPVKCWKYVFVVVERRVLVVDPLPIDFACKQHQLVLHVDDLLEPRSERIARSQISCFFGCIAPSDAATETRRPIRRNLQNEIASPNGLYCQNLAIENPRSRQNQTLTQRLTSCSRPSNQPPNGN